MPCRWSPATPDALVTLTLWPHRSLPRRGFVLFIGLTAALFVPILLSQLGRPGLWVMLPFLLAALAGVWLALERSYRDGQIVEVLTLSPATLTLTRHQCGAGDRTWQANPFWVRVQLYPTGGPVPQYLTLKAEGREVELGAFLSEEERLALHRDLVPRLAALRQPATP